MTTTEDLIIDSINDVLQDKSLWTPEFLARKFWEMNSGQQADFFNVLAGISKYHWSDMQWRYMQADLTNEGKELVNNIKLHTDNEEN